MDFNDLLLGSFLTYGRYDTETVNKSKARVCISYFIAFIELFCALKLMVIILVPSDRIEMALYLIDMYFANK